MSSICSSLKKEGRYHKWRTSSLPCWSYRLAGKEERNTGKQLERDNKDGGISRGSHTLEEMELCRSNH
jgi:hypothetical protein